LPVTLAFSMQQAFLAFLAGLLLLPRVHALVQLGSSGRRLRTRKSNCPGLQAICSGHGECDERLGTCWCRMGWGGTECNTEVTPIYEVSSVSDPSMQDMIGKFERVPMYVQEKPLDPQNVKFIHYDPISKGWAISKLNSSCTDDICFFAYANGQPVPPPKGYVYGEPSKHVYYKQLVFDDCDLYPQTGREPGLHMTVSYTPDPNALEVSEELNELSGRYVLQPRFVHSSTGKYAIMPVNLDCPGKLWYLLGLSGIGPARKWSVLAQSKDPSLNRYTVPAGGWTPPGGGLNIGFKLLATCNDHVSMDVCNSLEGKCRGPPGDKNVEWVQSCCRDTCNTCSIPGNRCALPNTAEGANMLLQMVKGNRTK